MENSEQSTKTAADSTPAAQPSDSQSDVENNDALPSVGADRGDIYGIKGDLAAELGLPSEGSNDETTSRTDQSGEPDSEDEETAAAQAAAELAPEAGSDGEAVAEAEEEAPSDEADSDEAPASEEKPPEAEAEKPKRDGRNDRIDELTARVKTAEEQLTTANERLAAYRARDEGGLTPDALDHVDTPDDLAQAKTRYNALLQWAIRNPDGGTLGEKEYDAAEVRELHAEVQNLVSNEIPAREKYLGERESVDREAVNFYPWLKDTGRGAGAFVQKAIESNPILRKMPAYRMLAADAFIGQALRSQGIQLTDALLKKLKEDNRAPDKGKAAAPAARKPAPAAPRKPPAAPGRAGVLPPRQSANAAAAKASQQRLRQGTGSEDDLADSIAAKL